MGGKKTFLDIINEHVASERTNLPAFNEISLRIQQETAKKDADIREIERLIVYDQALASQVLRMANSAFFMGLESVATVHEAIIRMGTDEIVNIVILTTQLENFRSDDPFVQGLLNDLWQHSVGCAIGTQWVAKRRCFNDILHNAFLAGLFHDVGKLFLLTVIEEIRQSKELHFQLSNTLIDEIMNTLHTEQGYLLMRNWNLPETYSEIARGHHAEELDTSNVLMAIVRLVNKVCNKAGIGMFKDGSAAPMVTQEANFLGLSEIALAELELKLEDSIASIQGLLASSAPLESRSARKAHPGGS
jgi:HD-like signal output (HDOD) protein